MISFTHRENSNKYKHLNAHVYMWNAYVVDTYDFDKDFKFDKPGLAGDVYNILTAKPAYPLNAPWTFETYRCVLIHPSTFMTALMENYHGAIIRSSYISDDIVKTIVGLMQNKKNRNVIKVTKEILNARFCLANAA